MLKEGLSHTSRMTVCGNHSAKALGSGDLEVCGTPAKMPATLSTKIVFKNIENVYQ